mmetsp:Transcript_120538/g.209237  ORF Transcript_120538/g.209237 Transcript_120538/m.209237 type:complete len:477 (-) Transcript_120538:47-1477(-)
MVGSQSSERAMEWRRDLQQFEDLVEHALRTEGHTVSHLLGRDAKAGGAIVEVGKANENSEPESEAVAAEVGTASEAKIDLVKQSVMRNVITPLLEAPWEQQEEQAGLVRQLPLVVEGLTALLRKTWLLAVASTQQQQQLSQELAASRAETRELADRLAREENDRKAAEAEAGQGEKAHDLLEGTVMKLTTARKTIKDMEWELVVVKRKCEELTRERTGQDRAIRDLQTALERHAIERSEVERRCLEVSSKADAEAAQQRGELRRQLSAVESERDKARAEMEEAAKNREDLLLAAEKRRADLEAELAESKQSVEQLGQQVRLNKERVEQIPKGRSSVEAPKDDDRASESSVHRRRSSTGTPSRRPPTAGATTSAAALAAGAGAMASRAAAAAKSFSFADTGLSAPAATAAGARPPPKTRRPPEGGSAAAAGRAPSTDSADGDGSKRTLERPSSHSSLPMDLRSLGQLLSGGAVKSRK